MGLTVGHLLIYNLSIVISIITVLGFIALTGIVLCVIKGMMLRVQELPVEYDEEGNAIVRIPSTETPTKTQQITLRRE